MLGTVINVILVVLGSIAGLIFKNHIKEAFIKRITTVLGLAVLVIGVSGAIKTESILCLVVCMVAGTLLGEWLQIEKGLDAVGESLRQRLVKTDGDSRFAEGFVSATLLFCIGSMAIMGSLEAGINKDYTILASKGVMDGVTSILFAASMGAGVIYSAIPILLYQGGITLLAGVVAPYLSEAAIVEMTAVGSTIIIGIAINMLGLAPEKLKVGNMLPAVFMPLFYLPLVQWLAKLL